MSNSTIRLTMRKAKVNQASDYLNDDGIDPDDVMVLDTIIQTLPESFDNVSRNCYYIGQDIVDRLSSVAQTLASKYLEEGSQGRVFPYQFAVRFGRQPYPEICCETEWFDLTSSDQSRLAKFAHLLLELHMSLLETEELWERAGRS